MPAITDFVSLEGNGNVGVVTVDNPPVNALSVGVRAGIKEAIESAASDDTVQALCAGLCRPHVYRRRRHHGIRQAAAAAGTNGSHRDD